MLEAGFIFIIAGLVLRASRDTVGNYLLYNIHEGRIHDDNLPGYRTLWRFFIYGWRPLIFLGVGLLLTKIFWG